MAKDEAWWNKFDSGELPGSKSQAWGRGEASPAHAPCYRSHRPLMLGETGLVVHGGSCADPAVKDADVYIGFDDSMRLTARHYPWTPGHEVLYRITDMQPPAEVQHFRKLVHWTAERLHAGDRVHCGCIGGHGRTGLFFAALVRHMTGIETAIDYVREHYCPRAVESREQISYLGKHFGVAAARGSKEQGTHSPWGGPQPGPQPGPQLGLLGGAVPRRVQEPASAAKSTADAVKPVRDKHSIWGTRCT